MKGRIICPKCKNEFILDFVEDKKIHDVICSKCNNKFTVEAKSESKELAWEEYGEPRKTVRSCIKPRSNKPLIAVVLLISVFLIGILTSVFYNIFIQTTLNTIYFIDIFKDNTNVGYSIIFVIFSIFALIAVFACIKRKYFGLAIFGSFIAVFSFGFFFIGSIFSIIALVIIYYSRDEFVDEKKAKIF